MRNDQCIVCNGPVGLGYLVCTACRDQRGPKSLPCPAFLEGLERLQRGTNCGTLVPWVDDPYNEKPNSIYCEQHKKEFVQFQYFNKGENCDE